MCQGELFKALKGVDIRERCSPPALYKWQGYTDTVSPACCRDQRVFTKHFLMKLSEHPLEPAARDRQGHGHSTNPLKRDVSIYRKSTLLAGLPQHIL